MRSGSTDWLDAGHGDKLSTIERIVLFDIAHFANSKDVRYTPATSGSSPDGRWAEFTEECPRPSVCLIAEIAEHGYHGKRSGTGLGDP